MAIKTVRVRIAVAVNARGELGVALAGDGSDAVDCALEMLDLQEGDDPALEAVHFVEADIPLPSPSELIGTVVECA